MLMYYVYQSSKGTKRKRSGKKSASPSESAPSKSSSKVLAGLECHSPPKILSTHNHHKEPQRGTHNMVKGTGRKSSLA